MTLAERMKTYEGISKTSLMIRTPVIVRVDGRAFHTYTKKFDKPKDFRIDDAMNATMLYLCKNIPGCILGYCQSDEISLVITDYKTLDTSPWFDYEVQKLVSVISSMATMAFNQRMMHLTGGTTCYGAMFDARAFNVPAHEVENYLIWRQQDCIRNVVSSYARSKYSQKEVHGHNSDQLILMLAQKGIIWTDLDSKIRNGRLAMKSADEGACELKWNILEETPFFLEVRESIANLVNNPM